jgi:hypothetical protein
LRTRTAEHAEAAEMKINMATTLFERLLSGTSLLLLAWREYAMLEVK